MSSDVLQFQCGACQSVLTVPSQMAGVTGPCPICGQTVTSPAKTPVPAAPTSLFTTHSSQQPPAATGAGSGLMPMTGAGAPHLGSMGSQPTQPPSSSLQTPASPSQSGGFLSGSSWPPAEPPAPTWQQPGLGQTLLGGTTQPLQPTTLPSVLSPGQGGQGISGLGLPPRRAENQTPATGALQQPAAPWGSSPSPSHQPATYSPLGTTSPLFPQARAGLSSPGQHGGIPPAQPTLPVLGALNSQDAPPSSLLSRDFPPSAPVPIPSQQDTQRELPASQPRPSRPIKKPGRSQSSAFMFALAMLFLAGFLAAAGWMFRAPITELVHRYFPSKEGDLVPVIPSAEANAPVPDSSTALTEVPAPEAGQAAAMAESVAPATSGFDPQELVAKPAMPADLAAVSSSSPSIPPAAGGLVEIPPKPMTPGVQHDSSPADPAGRSLAGPGEMKIEVSPEAKPAADALIEFLNAGDLKERMRHTLASNSMKPLMERYYQAQPSGPIRVDAIGLVRLDPKPQMGGGAHAVFGVESRTWEYPIPVMLEETPEGFKVDWLSFVEFKDRLLEKFFEGYQEGPARFHVGITRTHYFEDQVPNADNKDAFRLGSAPPNPYLTSVFVEKDSQLGRDLKDRIPWGAQVWAIVDLEWVKLGSQQWVQLVGVPQLNWYSVPAEPKPKSGKSGELPNDVQRAVPVGR